MRSRRTQHVQTFDTVVTSCFFNSSENYHRRSSKRMPSKPSRLVTHTRTHTFPEAPPQPWCGVCGEAAGRREATMALQGETSLIRPASDSAGERRPVNHSMAPSGLRDEFAQMQDLLYPLFSVLLKSLCRQTQKHACTWVHAHTHTNTHT